MVANRKIVQFKGGVRLITMFHIIFAAAVTGTLIHFWLTRSQSFSTERVVEVCLLYLLCVQWGFGAAFLAIPHIIFSDQVAEFIG